MNKSFSTLMLLSVFGLELIGGWSLEISAAPAADRSYRALAPISHGNLTIFPVVTDVTHDASMFLTLDEGLRSGEVVVTEGGRIPPLMRRRRPIPIPQGDQVNRLVLINNSDRPLLLLAGEIVTGGKQDRVVAKDRIVPPQSDPVDLSVFCVEPGRWAERTVQFGSLGAQMAQPKVRGRAMADKDQARVWEGVRESASRMAMAAPAAAEVVANTSSYATVADNTEIKKQVDSVAKPIESSYRGLTLQLRDRKAVGVVVAVNGRIIWADIFASTALLEKYWPKLVRSYAAEAITTSGASGDLSVKDAQAFLNDMQGVREVVETEPGIFRHTEVSGPATRTASAKAIAPGDTRWKLFELTSLLPKTGFDVHIAKMAEDGPVPLKRQVE